MDISGVGGAGAVSAASLQYSISTKMMKEAMALVEDSMGTLLEGLEASLTGVGGNIDMLV